MSLYVIRHGKTKMNGELRFNGSVDEDLSEEGILQAIEAGQKLQDKKFKMIICSPMKRTMQTLAYMGLSEDIPVLLDDRLIERIEGDLTGVQITPEILRDIYLNRNATPDIAGFETIDEMLVRVHSLLNEIKSDFANDDILLVTHGMVGRIIYYYFNKLPESGYLGDDPDSYPGNCEVRVYNFEKFPLELQNGGTNSGFQERE